MDGGGGVEGLCGSHELVMVLVEVEEEAVSFFFTVMGLGESV